MAPEKSSLDSMTLPYDLLKWAVPTLKKFRETRDSSLGTKSENTICSCMNYIALHRYEDDLR